MNWRTIKDYPNYEVSDTGLVMNKEGCLLSPNDNGHGYLKIDLCKNSKRKTCKIHKLVAEAFIPNPDNKREVDHIDRCKDNNCVSNLRWTTPSENCQNKGVYKNNKLGIKNISYDKRNDRFVFSKGINGKIIYKYFKTLEEAKIFRENYLKRNGK